MAKLRCENPTYILHPHAQQNIVKYGAYMWKGQVFELNRWQRADMLHNFDYRRFSARLNGVNAENIDSYGIITPEGEVLPLFIAVPCGKCILCREKKRNEWACRAICESQLYDNRPFFITLTYAPEWLPADGVNKRDVQLFLKRLRILLERRGFTNKIRYFMVSEYGKNTHRAHYHGILYNLPAELKTTDILHLVEDAWNLGFCYCRPCDEGSTYYSMKYMRKDMVVPKGQNEPFFLSSRRGGGIGAGFCDKYKDFYRANPDELKLTFSDKFSGRKFEFNLPAYFVGRIFPTIGKMIPKEYRDNYKLALWLAHARESQCQIYGNNGYGVMEVNDLFEVCPFLAQENFIQKIDRAKVSDEDAFLRAFGVIQVNDLDEELKELGNRSYFAPAWYLQHISKLKKHAPEHLTQIHKEYSKEYDRLMKYFKSVQLDIEEIQYILNATSKRKVAINVFMASQPEINIADEVAKVKNKRDREKNREIL